MNVEQHQDYQKWLKELDFYKSEIVVFEKELNRLVEKHPALLSIIEHVEEYQIILEKKKNRIRVLIQQIKMKDSAMSLVDGGEEKNSWDYNDIKLERADFVKNMETLKKSFRRFVAKNIF